MTRLLTLLRFARKLRFHLNRDEPQSFGGAVGFLVKKSELEKDLLALVGVGFVDTDTILVRLSKGRNIPRGRSRF